MSLAPTGTSSGVQYPGTAAQFVTSSVPFTMACWMFASTTPTPYYSVIQIGLGADPGTGTGNQASIYVNTASVICYSSAVGGAGTTITGTVAYPSWNHYAFTCDASNNAVGYFNGVATSLGTMAQTAGGWFLIKTGFFLSPANNGIEYQDSTFWSRALSAVEITRLMRERRPVGLNLEGWYPFLGGGTRLADFSGKQRTATVIGTAADGTRTPPAAWGTRNTAYVVSASGALAVVPSGVVLTSGAAAMTADAAASAASSTLATGTAATATAASLTASASLLTSGTAATVTTGAVAASGTLLTSGAAALAAFEALGSQSGTLLSSGASTLTSAVTSTASGLSLTSGVAAMSSSAGGQMSAGGDVLASGSAATSSEAQLSAAGIVLASGAAQTSTSAPIAAASSTIASGAVPMSAAALVAATPAALLTSGAAAMASSAGQGAPGGLVLATGTVTMSGGTPTPPSTGKPYFGYARNGVARRGISRLSPRRSIRFGR